MNVAQELELFVQRVAEIPPEKSYWMIRTQSGNLYDTFRVNGFVALEHDEISLNLLTMIREAYGKDFDAAYQVIKHNVTNAHKALLRLNEGESDLDLDLRRITLISNQIFKFLYEVKRGDIVIIPSSNSDLISFGVVQENFIASFTQEEVRRHETSAVLKKRIRWIDEQRRRELDPNLYRMFTAHQALNDVSSYAEVIERSLLDFFVLDQEAHIVINVKRSDHIPAGDLFNMGSEILRLVDEFAQFYRLDISSRDLEVTINLNSPGKIDLKSKAKKTTVVAGLLLATVGGGYYSKDGSSLKTEGAAALIRAVDQFMDHQHDRDLKTKVFEHYKDSLHISEPQDMINLLKQFSDNRDNPR